MSNNWSGNLQYEHAVDATNALMAANTDWIFKGILWHQGEDQNNSNFANQFYLMIQSMRRILLWQTKRHHLFLESWFREEITQLP